jgi:hypothetical protein
VVKAPGSLENGALAAAPAAAAPLPCLSTDNSDEPSVKRSSADRKRAEVIRQNIALLQRISGPALGFLTIAFAADLTTKEAQRKLANFKRRVLEDNFGHSITVREFTLRGRPHFHLAATSRPDLTGRITSL